MSTLSRIISWFWPKPKTDTKALDNYINSVLGANNPISKDELEMAIKQFWIDDENISVYNKTSDEDFWKRTLIQIPETLCRTIPHNDGYKTICYKIKADIDTAAFARSVGSDELYKFYDIVKEVSYFVDDVELSVKDKKFVNKLLKKAKS